MHPLELVADWPVTRAAAAIQRGDDPVESVGDVDTVFELASVTKLITALAVLVAVEEGSLALDETATDAGATVADLLCHAGGLAPDEHRQMAPPGSKRIYSTSGYERLAVLIQARTGMAFATYADEAVAGPLGMTATRVYGSAGWQGRGNVSDMTALASGWRRELVVHRATLDIATAPARPDLDGVLPGFGRFTPNPWGLGPEIKGQKSPHWTGSVSSPATFGHFGRSGTMLWVDPEADTTVVALTDEPFGPWATTHWPRFSDAVAGL